MVRVCDPKTRAGLCVTRSKGLPPLEAKCCRKTSQSRLSRLRSFQKLFPVLVCRRRLKRDWEVLRQHFASRGGKPLLLVTHSPAAVLGWIRGMQPEPDLVYRVFSYQLAFRVVY